MRFSPSTPWSGPPAAFPSSFYREGEPQDDDHRYVYLGSSFFFCETTNEYWEWCPESRIPYRAEGFSKTSKRPTSTAGAILWPYFVQFTESHVGSIPPLVVNSSSIRNFEAADNGRALIGVLNLSYTARRYFCEIFLSPLVLRTVMDDAPWKYATDRVPPPASPDGKFPLKAHTPGYIRNYKGKERPMAAGRWLEHIEDTRQIPEWEKVLRTRNSNLEEATSRELFRQAQLTIHNTWEATRQGVFLPPAAKKPLSVLGSSHEQLRSAVTDTKLACIGFTVTKKNIMAATFNDTSGTLNSAHFGSLGIGPNWKLHIMRATAYGLRVSLTEDKAPEPISVPLDTAGRQDPLNPPRVRE